VSGNIRDRKRLIAFEGQLRFREEKVMKYTKPEVFLLPRSLEAIQTGQNKGSVTLVDFIRFPIILFATPFAYEADE
jgi:hypothetical protein